MTIRFQALVSLFGDSHFRVPPRFDFRSSGRTHPSVGNGFLVSRSAGILMAVPAGLVDGPRRSRVAR